MVKVVLCTDEAALALGFIEITRDCEDLQASWRFSSVSEMVRGLEGNPPDLLLLDWCAFSDFDILAAVKSKLPHCRTILWVRDISVEFASYAIAFGIRGILPKTVSEEQLLQCIRSVASGEIWLENSLTTSLLEAKPLNLTPRERELVGLLSQGLRNKEIAAQMDLSEGTVKIYLSRLFQKVGAKDRLELALFGLRHGASSTHAAGFNHFLAPLRTVTNRAQAAIPSLAFPRPV